MVSCANTLSVAFPGTWRGVRKVSDALPWLITDTGEPSTRTYAGEGSLLPHRVTSVSPVEGPAPGEMLVMPKWPDAGNLLGCGADVGADVGTTVGVT